MPFISPLRGLLLSLTLTTLASCTRVPIGFWSRNRFNQNDQRHGPWRGYMDAQEQHLLSKGRYLRGREVGHWKYFSPTGQRERIEKFRSNGLITLILYHPNGQMAKRDRARFLLGDATDRFFWFGEWRCYDATGQPLPSEYYVNGIRTAAVLPDSSIK